jgi:hypothetical protein
MAGRPEKNNCFNFERDGIILDQSELANSLNEFYASVNNDIPTLDVTKLPTFLPAAEPTRGLNRMKYVRSYQQSNLSNPAARTIFLVES